MIRPYWHLLTLTILLALTLTACGGKGNDTPSAKETTAPAAQATVRSSTAQKQPTTEPAMEAEVVPTDEPTEAPAATSEDESLSLASRDTGLDALASYRLTWHAEWKSTDQGKEDQGTWDWAEEYTSDPKARHLSMLTPDVDASDPAKTIAFEMWQIGDTSYMKSGEDEECMSFSTEGAGNDIQKGTFSPSMLGSIEDAKYVGRETINGVPTKHYKYSSKTGMLTSLGEVSGETWVAIDGGYVVKDTVTWKGGGLLFRPRLEHRHRRRNLDLGAVGRQRAIRDQTAGRLRGIAARSADHGGCHREEPVRRYDHLQDRREACRRRHILQR